MGLQAQFRPAESQDSAAVASLIRDAFPVYVRDKIIYGCPGVVRFIQSQIAVQKYAGDTAYFVSTVGDELVGCVELRRFPQLLWLNYIAVTPEWQRKGLARRLLAYSIASFERSAPTEMALDVFDFNQAASSWYRQLGFKAVRDYAWYEVSVPDLPNANGFAALSGFPQAQAAHDQFGFSQFNVTTRAAQYVIGRLGKEWFRTTQPEAWDDADLMHALRTIDAGRRLLGIFPGDVKLLNATSRRLFTSTRMTIELPRLKSRLLAREGPDPDLVAVTARELPQL